jgi:hypothetical protein
MKQMQTRAWARASGQTTAQGYFQVYILHQLSVLAHRLLSALKMVEPSENDYIDTEKLII